MAKRKLKGKSVEGKLQTQIIALFGRDQLEEANEYGAGSVYLLDGKGKTARGLYD